MNLRKIGIVNFIIFLVFMAFSMPAFSETEGERQEKLGKAIQQAALLNRINSTETGPAQERLGQAIQEAAQSSIRVTAREGELQEELGHQIQDAAVLEYAQGRTQERMGETLLQMARS